MTTTGKKVKVKRKGESLMQTIPLESLIADMDSPDKSAILSDGGKGAEEIRAAADPEPPVDMPAERLRRYKTAWEFVKRKAPECLKAFNLIVKFGKKRRSSIWRLIPFKERVRLVEESMDRVFAKRLISHGELFSYKRKSPGCWEVTLRKVVDGEVQTTATTISVEDLFKCS